MEGEREMDFKKMCYSCMQEKLAEDSPCPHCGFDNRRYSAPANHLPPMTPLNGKYLIGKSIGQGGFGITYVAFDMQLQVVVAIKELFLKHIMSRDEDARTVIIPEAKKQAFEVNKKRFLREARVLAMFNENDNEGIVSVRDHFEENGTAYIVMEYLRGTTLKNYVRKNGKLSFEETKRLLTPVCHALTKVHEFNVIHKDVSPDNIMVLQDGKVKLMDFGGFTALYQDNPDEIVSFKRGYAPPEQYVDNSRIAPATDVYALAATMYYCLTGVKPPDAMDRRAGKELDLPSRLGAKINSAVEKNLIQALELEPQNRQKSVAEFLDSLSVNSGNYNILLVVILVLVVAVALFFVFGRGLLTKPGGSGTSGQNPGEQAEAADGGGEEDGDIVEKVEYEIGEAISFELGTYIFENYADPNYIMGIDSGFGDDGAMLKVRAYEDANRNRIMVTDVVADDGFYNLQAAHTNSYIQTWEAQEPGTEVIQTSVMTDTGTQKWYFIYCGHEDDKDVVIIKNAAGTVLAPQDGQVTDGTPVVLAEENMDDDTQKWYVRWSEKDLSETDVIVYHEGDLVESMEGVFTLASAYDGETMCSVSRYEELEEPEIIAWENVWDETQQFRFVLQNESRYKIYPINQEDGENKCLEHNEETGKIVLRDESDSTNQLFRVVYTGYNMYLLQTYNESVFGFDINEDGNFEGNAIFARPYEDFADSRQEKWLFKAVD